MHWINSEKLIEFILSAQDTENGGIADRPENAADVFHTHFGVAGESSSQLEIHLLTTCTSLFFCRWFIGLSLLGYPGLEDLDPVYCMPAKVIEKLGLRKGWKALPRKVE